MDKVDQITDRVTVALSQGSEYVPSSQSGEESEESDDDESDGRGETKFRIVGHEELLELFHRCKECGKLLDRSLIRVREEGGACTVEYDCLECGTFVPWQSQRRIGKGKSTVFEGNQSISIAAFITGVQIPRFNDFGKLIGLGLPSERAMRRAIRDIGCPAIERVFMIWQRTVRQVSKDAAEPDGISVAIDGQYDNPGWNGSNCKATVMDAKTKLAIAGCSVHKKEPGIDGVSIRMESTGILRAMEELIDDGFVSDRNKMVDKKLREHPKTKSIVAENDWWHTQKPLKKEWWRAMKNSPIIAQLYCPFFNHIFYCHKKFPKKEDRPKALELVRSFLMHVQGKHRWKKGKKFQIITKCDHEKLKRRKKGDPPRPILKPSSKEYKLIEDMLYSRNFEKAFLDSSSLIDTALNESYHSLSLISPYIYNIKMKLSMMHHNSLILHEMQGLRKELPATLISRPGRVAPSVKTKRESGSHPWRDQVI
ncbi:hypothetical protein PMAYCL1PPCAC_26094, partial [Pristionchus mayeri]